MTPTCQSCVHFLPTYRAGMDADGNEVSVTKNGVCRRYPPDPIMVNGNNLQHRFRLIERPAETLCGEHAQGAPGAREG